MKKLCLIFIFLLQTITLFSVESPPISPGAKIQQIPKIIKPTPVPTPAPKAVTIPVQSTKVGVTSQTPVIKTPLQLNIKNNYSQNAHLTGFTVTYDDETTEKQATITAKTDMHIAPNHTKSIGFKVKIPNTGSTPKFNPFVSEIEINGASISTGYKAIPHTPDEQPYTLALLQITQKNGTWMRDIKAMKKADSIIPAPSAVPVQSKSKITPLKEAVVAAAIEKNKNSKSKSKFKKSTKKLKKIKKSKSSQAVDHALVR